MKKRFLYTTLLVPALVTALTACSSSKPAESQTSSESSSAEETVKASDKEASDYVYAKIDIPYADFYYGELNDVEPEKDTASLKANLDAEDMVEKAGFRKDGEYDSVSSPTGKKIENFKAAYGNVDGETSEIIGASKVNIAISKSLYEDAKKAIEEKKESKNPLLKFVEEIKETSETEPADYKVLNSDGTFSKTIGKTKKDTSAKAEITSTSNYGNYEIEIKENEELDPDTIIGALLETDDGKKYGLKHLDNIWTKPTELAFSAAAFTDAGHKAEKEFARFADMQGKTVKKITYLVLDADDIEIETSLFVKNLAPAEYKVSGDEKVAYSKDGTSVNYKLETGDKEYKLSRVISRKADLDISNVKTDETGTLLLPKDYTPGTYQLVFSNDEYTDVSFKVLLESGLKAEDFSFENNKLTLKENANELDIKTYIASTNSGKIGENEYKGGRGRKLGKTIFNEDGSINLDASIKSDSGETKIFDGADKFPVSIKAAGYPDIEFEVVK